MGDSPVLLDEVSHKNTQKISHLKTYWAYQLTVTPLLLLTFFNGRITHIFLKFHEAKLDKEQNKQTENSFARRGKAYKHKQQTDNSANLSTTRHRFLNQNKSTWHCFPIYILLNCIITSWTSEKKNNNPFSILIYLEKLKCCCVCVAQMHGG